VIDRCHAEALRRAPPPAKKKPGKKKVAPAPPSPDPKLEGLCLRLAEWDGEFDVDSRNAPLWRELMVELGAGGDVPWLIPYDRQAPSTPAGLAPPPRGQPDPVIAGLERAAARLAAAGFDPATASRTLGDLQRAAIGEGGPVPGGAALDGTASVASWVDWNGTLLPRATRAPAISPSGLGPDGYPINYGNSWIMVVELGSSGPVADVLLSYGPPGDEEQVAMLARGQLRPALFDAAAIADDQNLYVEEVIEQ
jgi:acyl-homoserine-lactone acylase